jgi:hypothetical protein
MLASMLDSIPYAKVFGAAALLGLPWVSTWEKLDWHFKRGEQSLGPIFNGIASVLAMLLFTGSVYKTPPEWWVRLPLWPGFIAVGVLAIIYVGMLLAFKESVAQNRALVAVIIALACYIALWGVAATYTRQVFIFRDYRVYGGFAYLDGNPAPTALIALLDENGERISATRTNKDGSWLDFRSRLMEDGSTLTKRPTTLSLEIPSGSSIEQPLVEEGRIDHVYRFQTPAPSP